jgi:hypothetical protein
VIGSFPIAVHGKQAGASYNGHYRNRVYHPLVASFSVRGDYDSGRNGDRLGNGFLHATLRQGQVHTANGMNRFVDKVDQKAQKIAQNIEYRLDAGYTIGTVMDSLSRKSRRFVGRLKSNPKLDRLAEQYLRRPPGRPPAGGYEDVFELGSYQADSWEYPQRLILVVVDQPDFSLPYWHSADPAVFAVVLPLCSLDTMVVAAVSSGGRPNVGLAKLCPRGIIITGEQAGGVAPNLQLAGDSDALNNDGWWKNLCICR